MLCALSESYVLCSDSFSLSWFRAGMTLPSDPRIKVRRLVTKKCRYMSSKMVCRFSASEPWHDRRLSIPL